MDYLFRDSYFAGVKYGQYDIEKLIESCLIVDRRETPLAISSKGIYALEKDIAKVLSFLTKLEPITTDESDDIPF